MKKPEQNYQDQIKALSGMLEGKTMKKVKTRNLYQIREYKTPNSYSSPLGEKLRTRWRSVKLITRLTLSGHRDIVMVPFCVTMKG